MERIGYIRQLANDYIGRQRDGCRNDQLQFHREYQRFISNRHHPGNSNRCNRQSGGCYSDTSTNTYAYSSAGSRAVGDAVQSICGKRCRYDIIQCIQYRNRYHAVERIGYVWQLAYDYIWSQRNQFRNHQLQLHRQYQHLIPSRYHTGNRNRCNRQPQRRYRDTTARIDKIDNIRQRENVFRYRDADRNE